MIIERNKLKLCMARKCMNTKELQETTKIPRATINNAITGRSVSPKTAGIIASALNVDVSELLSSKKK